MVRRSVITIGTFDGVHKGHKLLINKTLIIAKKYNLISIIVMLEKPVKSVHGLLTTYKEKLEKIKLFGMDKIFVIKVPSKILSCYPEEFFNKFLCSTLNIERIVCGPDFAFGKNKNGNVEWLKKKNVKICVIKPLKYVSKQISSSLIRTLIEEGDIKKVAKLLGRNYSFTGIPFKGKGIGSKLGFPTINLRISKEKLLPKGVYVSIITQKNIMYPSITNIGTRPTFNQKNKIVPEIHILNFKKMWKKSKSEVILLKKIRNEKKFINVKLLTTQIVKDVSKAIHFFKL
ncbi:MAG: riboflavin biosynthesis protein RibF [Endomicrobium sp.]|jgi:riboflavin kinase/FMN adenylyltransferase|nr:riboflavin biosynthesis protein RibF [Endomicrobium sp.]